MVYYKYNERIRVRMRWDVVMAVVREIGGGGMDKTVLEKQFQKN